MSHAKSDNVPSAIYMKPLALYLFLVFSTSLLAENWPRFRGPNGIGVSAGEIPVTWKSDHFKWKTKLPGVGHGSPVVWEGQIYLLCANEDTGQRTAVGLDAKTGRILWQQMFQADKHKHHKHRRLCRHQQPDTCQSSYIVRGRSASSSLLQLQDPSTKNAS